MAHGSVRARPSLAHNAWAVYLCVGTALLAAYLLLPLMRNGLVINFISLSAAVAIGIGVRRNRPATRRPWQLLIVAQMLYVTGDALYFSYSAVFDSVPAFPSLNDLFYLSFYPTAMAGLLVLIRRRSPGGDLNSLIDALIVTVGLALSSWVFLIAPYAHDPSLTILQKVVSIAYPSMDVGLLAVAARLAVDGGWSRPSSRLLLLGIVSLLATDAVYGLHELSGGFDPGGLLEVGWASFYLLWGAAALHPSMRELDQPRPRTLDTLTWQRLALLTAASLMAPAVLAILVLRGEARAESVIIGSTVALFVLVIGRMAGLVRDRERAASRERALREAARGLVGATGRQDVLDSALLSLRALVGPGGDVRVTEPQPSGEVRVWMEDGDGATSWSVAATDLSPLDAEQLSARGVLAVDAADAHLRQALRLPASAGECLALPLLVRGELRGVVFVTDDGDFTGDLTDALQTMTVQVCMALESAILAEAVHRRRSEERFRSLVQHSSDLIMVIAPDTTITYASPSVQRALERDVDGLRGSRFYDLMHPNDRDHFVGLLADGVEALDGDGGDASRQGEMAETRLRHADGSWRHFEILHTNLLQDEDVAGIVLNARDVSERKVFEAQLRQLAFRDPVTTLANRALFIDRIEHAIARMARDRVGLGVIFADLDDFKVVNDSLGHAAGDILLQRVGQRLLGCVRTMDTVARFGGDEFAVLIEDVTRIEDLAGIAEKIVEALAEPFVIDGNEVFIGASMGIATIDPDDTVPASADALLRNADIAMYIAKHQCKGLFRVFEPDMHASALDRLELKGALQRAIERGELELHYQPIVSLDDERVRGLEALVRWRHPQRGLIAPAEFIPIAEETGLIGALGRWVLGQACEQGRMLQQVVPQTPPLRINVNLSVRQLRQASLVTEVAEALAASRIDPSSVTLEITESVLVDDSETTIGRLEELKRLGIRLAIDDFGTGYSSLSYLSRFPVDYLKIDRSFIIQLSDGTDASALATAIIQIGRTLELPTVAEGIERPEQLAALRRMHCDFGQGFLFARPMPFDDTVAYLGGVLAATAATAE